MKNSNDHLTYLLGELKKDLSELQSLKPYLSPADNERIEAFGVPESN